MQVSRVSTGTGCRRFSMACSLHSASAYFRKHEQSVGGRLSKDAVVDGVAFSSPAATVSSETGLLVLTFRSREWL